MDQSPIQLRFTNALGRERFRCFMFGERQHIRKLVCFFRSYQCARYLIILQHLELLPAKTVGSLWTARSTTPLRTLSAAPKELFHTDKIPQFPPALHFKYHLKLPHIERLRLSCHRAAGCKNCSRNSTPDLLSWILLSENLNKNCFMPYNPH